MGQKVVIRDNYNVIAEHYDFNNFYLSLEDNQLVVSYGGDKVYKYPYRESMDFCVMPYVISKTDWKNVE